MIKSLCLTKAYCVKLSQSATQILCLYPNLSIFYQLYLKKLRSTLWIFASSYFKEILNVLVNHFETLLLYILAWIVNISSNSFILDETASIFHCSALGANLKRLLEAPSFLLPLIGEESRSSSLFKFKLKIYQYTWLLPNSYHRLHLLYPSTLWYHQLLLS